MKSKVLSRTVIALAIAAGLSTAYYAGHQGLAPQVIEPVAAMPLMPAEAAAKTGVPDFSGLVEAYGNAVVNISARHQVKVATQGQQAQQQLPLDPSDPFYQLFKHFYGGQMPDTQAPSESLGSGFIVSADGYILTNAHVIDGANVVTVKLTDKREYRAKVIGSDKQSDVAVLKIDAKDLPTVKIGNPDQSKVGQWVVAIGSPYGFDNTVTSGIISAKARSLPDETYIPFIQTDVPVNPGTSGGPLFNLNGEVIGINSMIYSQTGGFQGLSFAIPINAAIKVKNELVETGHVERSRIGVTVQQINQQLAKSFGLPTPAGALVSSVEKDGPAAKAGLKPGDVILQVNQLKVNDSSDLPGEIADIKPGTQAQLQIWRDGATKTINVTTVKLTDKTLASANSDAPQGKLGVAVRPMTPQEKQDASVSHGLLVMQSSGPAANAGIEPGDVILAIDGQPVTTAAQLRDRIEHADGSVALLIQRDDAQIFVPVDLS